MKNLKKLYDAAQQAEARLQDLIARFDTLIGEGKTAEAKAMKPELEQAKAEAKEANELYMTARDISPQGASEPAEDDPARRVMQFSDDDLTIGMAQREINNYSLLRAIRAIAARQTGDTQAMNAAGLEMEASRAMAQKLGRQPKGFFVPWDVAIAPVANRGGAMRIRNDQQAQGPTTGGYLIATELQSQSFIDVLRNKIVTRQAGANVLTGLVGDIDIPKKTAASSAYWIGEGTSPTKSTMTFGQVEARPRTAAAYLQLTRRFIKQSSLDAEMMVRDDVASTIALAVDYAGLHGKGAANEPRGIASTTGIGSVAGGTNGDYPDWSDIVDLESEVAIDNADIGALAYITNTKVRGKLKKTLITATYGETFVWGAGPNPLNGYQAYVTNQVASTLVKGNSTAICSAIFFGNWADLIYCFWAGLDVIVDPYTNSTSGDVLITAMQDVDVVVRRPESFAAMLDAKTA